MVQTEQMKSIALIVFLCSTYFSSYLFYEITKVVETLGSYRQRERREMLLNRMITRQRGRIEGR